MVRKSLNLQMPRSMKVTAAAVGALFSIVAAGAPPDAGAQVPQAITGVWLDDTGQGAVEVYPCGDKLCGRIVWMKAPFDKSGKPQADVLNPDQAKRQRHVCGLQVIGDLKRQTNGSWDQGWIYDPKVGKSYDVELKLARPDRLTVTGYIGTKLLSETFVWTRAQPSLKSCSI